MNIKLLFFIVALVAVAAALYAWVTASFKNANRKAARHPWRVLYLIPLLWPMRLSRPRCSGVQFANIGEGTQEHGVKTYIPDAATTARYLCYKIGTDGDHSAVCGAGDTPLGQSDDQADAGVGIAINLFGLKPGTLRVVTDGTIANGDHVKCAAAGQVTKASTTDRSFGIALIGTDSSSAAGDPITIQHCVPHLYVF